MGNNFVVVNWKGLNETDCRLQCGHTNIGRSGMRMVQLLQNEMKLILVNEFFCRYEK